MRTAETATVLELPVEAASVREARKFVARLAGLAPDGLLDAQLVVSELVTNALLHAHVASADRIVLRVSRRPTGVRIDVEDGGTFTADSESFAYSSHADHRLGLGLRLVQSLTSRWEAIDGRVTAWLPASG